VWFKQDSFDSIDNRDPVGTEDEAITPEVRSWGSLPSLQNASATDENLRRLLEQFSKTDFQSVDQLIAKTREIAFAWAGVTTQSPDSVVTSVDSRELMVVEAFYGQKLQVYDIFGNKIPQINIAGGTARTIDQYFNNIVSTIASHLLAYYSSAQTNDTIDDATKANDYQSLAYMGYSPSEDFFKGSDILSLSDYIRTNDWMTGYTSSTDSLRKIDIFMMVEHTYYKERNSNIAFDIYISTILDGLRSNGIPDSLALDIQRYADMYSSSDSNNLQIHTALARDGSYVQGIGLGLWNNNPLGNPEDIYVHIAGDGDNIISDDKYMGLNDSLYLFGLSINEIAFSKSGDDMVLSYSASDRHQRGSVTIRNEFLGEWSGIEKIYLVDGVLTKQQAIQKTLDSIYTDREDIINGSEDDDLIHGGQGNDTLTGRGGNDWLVGGPGDDGLNGGEGDNTYVYNRGDGNDTITSWGYGQNRLVLHEIDPTGIRLSTNGTDLIIGIAATSDRGDGEGSIRVGGIGNVFNGPTVQTIIFDDGTVWTFQAAMQMAIASQATDGNDTILGSLGDDIVTGGKGDDVLSGGTGNDTYVYNRGDGHDRIINQTGWTYEGQNTLAIHGVNANAIGFDTDSNDLTVTIAETAPGAGDGGTVHIDKTGDNFGSRIIKTITLDDGTAWTYEEALQKALNAQSTDGNDTITGSRGNDVLQGGRGDDTLSGDLGDDTYVYNRGDGHDRIRNQTGWNQQGQNTLLLHGIEAAAISVTSDSNDLTLTIAETSPGAGDGGSIHIDAVGDNFGSRIIKTIVLDDGTQWTYQQALQKALDALATDGDDTLIGSWGNDILRGGRGNDTLWGGLGDDTFVYARGDGNDLLTNASGWNAQGQSVLQLHEIAPDDVVFTSDGVNLTATIKESAPGVGDGGSLRMTGRADNLGNPIVRKIAFDDGTIWTWAQAQQMAIDHAGTPGDDVITGTSGNDILRGRGGDDTLRGGLGDDTYVYARGDGNDVLANDTGWNGQGWSTLVLNDIDQSSVSYTIDGQTVIAHIAESSPGIGDSGTVTITIGDNFQQPVVRAIRYDDGSVVTFEQARQSAIAAQATPGPDHILGGRGDDILAGGAGDDILEGGLGNDTYVYGRGDGNDTLVNNTGWNGQGQSILSLKGIAPSEVRYVSNGRDLTVVIPETSAGNGDGGSVMISGLGDNFEQPVARAIVFDDGTRVSFEDGMRIALASAQTPGDDLIWGTKGDDQIRGGKGDDVINGYRGNDTYLYARGDGNDVLRNYTEWNYEGQNVLKLEDLTPGDVILTRQGRDLLITIPRSADGQADGGSVVIGGIGDKFDSPSVGAIQFGDGSTMTFWQAMAKANDAQLYKGTFGDDAFVSTAGDEIFTGLGGSNAYAFAPASGRDVITDFKTQGAGHDLLKFDHAIFADASQALAAASQVGNDTVIALSANDQLTLKNTPVTSLTAAEIRIV
jgi:Ca2+-binding RTX toxin-like protein